MTRPSCWLPIAVAGLFALLAAGCSNEHAAERDPAAGADAAVAGSVHAGMDTLAPTFPDAAPGEKQMPRPIVRLVRQKLEPWTLAWHAALPTLRLDQFARTGILSIAGDDEGPFVGGVEGTDLRLLHLVVPSPDVMLVLDPWLDLELVRGSREGDAIKVVRDDEPGVGLIDLKRRRERRLFDLPAGSRVDGAHWVDDHRVIVMVDEPAKGGRRPVLHLVDVVAQTDTRYEGPLAEPVEAALARTELDRRFLAARPALAFGRPESDGG